MDDLWFESVEALSSVQRISDELQQAMNNTKNHQELQDHVIEIIDLYVADALNSSTKVVIRASGAEAYIERTVK
jgi:hypothetical protein